MKRHPIVILHGWNLSAAKLAPLQHELEKRNHTVVCFDLPGFAHTAPLDRAYTLPDYSQYVLDVLKKKKISEAIVIGHSFGGRLGIHVSVTSPSLVKALILSGTPGLGADLTPKETVYLFLAKIGNIIFSVWPLSLVADVARKILYKFAGSYDYYKTSGLLRETFKQIVNFRLEPLLPKIAAPTLILWGNEDNIVPVRVAYGMQQLIPHSQLTIIPNARHAVPWSHPKEFADAVEKFLKNYQE